MAEPTGTLTFKDLILEVSRKMGWGDYGVNGDEELQIPTDPADLATAKRLVNIGIRTFISDAPVQGWRWATVTKSVDLWPTILVDDTNLINSTGYDPLIDKTTLVTQTDSFFESMEEHKITITGFGDFVISDYISATTIKIRGEVFINPGVTWTIVANGNYTFPRDFGGAYNGQIVYSPDSNLGIIPKITQDSVVRQRRSVSSNQTGDPLYFALRVLANPDSRRRWELITFPTPDSLNVITIPYHIYFDQLKELDEVHPAPFFHDETIRLACLAAAEVDFMDAPGPDFQRYRELGLANSFAVDARSAPKRINGISHTMSAASFRDLTDRQTPIIFNL